MTRFYHLTHPRYPSDRADEVANPVIPIHEIGMPGVVCPACGAWSGSRRLYLEIPDAGLKRRLQARAPLPLADWLELARQVRAAANVAETEALHPGDVLGAPQAELLHAALPDFLHPFPGHLIVRAAVVEALRKNEVTGVRALRVEGRWGGGLEAAPAPPPELYELIVLGRAWRVGVQPEDIVACPICRRTVFPAPDRLRVDEARWDRSDVFHVDENPNLVFVTEKVCAVLRQGSFTNYECVPLAPA